jgi:hypothetical protein
LKFDIPTLIIHGDDDQIVPSSGSPLLSSKRVKDATLKVYPGAPHGLTGTHKEQFNADLLSFCVQPAGHLLVLLQFCDEVFQKLTEMLHLLVTQAEVPILLNALDNVPGYPIQLSPAFGITDQLGSFILYWLLRSSVQNKPFETEKQILSLLANKRWLSPT